MFMTYEPVIGLEIHAELKTKTKMFCSSRNDPDEKHPNINICPVCMGHPGTLPVINREAVTHVIRAGLALNGEISAYTQFDRKNYFYPDLPKGYQISQYKHPLVNGGYLDIEVDAQNGEIKFPISNSPTFAPPSPKWLLKPSKASAGTQFPNKSQISNSKDQKGRKRIRITRIHLEEDTGRLIHDPETAATLVDFNRAGVPLMELVTEPDFRNGEEVKAFGEELRQIFRYVRASDADMEKGQMRVEVNISLRPRIVNGREQGALGTKVEIKNINSFKFAADAIGYEIERQTAILERGEKVIQETRGWNEHKGHTFSQRKKEEAHDYRYFPEPDLPPLTFAAAYIEELRAGIPELPYAKCRRFVKEYDVEAPIAEILVRNKEFADYFEAVASEAAQHDKETPEKPSSANLRFAEGFGNARATEDKPRANLARSAAQWLTGEFLALLNEQSASIADIRVTPENAAELILLFAEGKISHIAAKHVLEEMFRNGEDPSDIIERRGLWQISGAEDLEGIVRHIVSENPKAVQDHRAGKGTSIQFLIGQVMKESRGKANPKVVGEILSKILSSNS